MLLYKFTEELGGKETPVLGHGGKTLGRVERIVPRAKSGRQAALELLCATIE